MHIKHVIGATGFFSLGALVAWAITADKYDRMLHDLEGRVNEIEQGYLQRYAETLSLYEANLNQPVLLELDDETEVHFVNEPKGWDDVDTDDEPDIDDATMESSLPEDETPEETRRNLQNIIDQYTANPQDRDEFVHQAISNRPDHKPPYVISRDEYAYGEDGESHAKATLTYYPRDRVLLDDDDDLIEDIPGTIGWRSLSNFGGDSGDPDVVFVRNDRLVSDFEVIKEEDSELPLHVKYGMGKEEFRLNKAAGTLKLRREDE